MSHDYDVTYQRAEYTRALPRWELVEDCCAGQSAIKAAGVKYLPKPNPLDNSLEAKARYDDYAFRAVFYNATGRTEQGLVGMAYRLVPTLETPSSIAYVETDVDGAGLSIYQQSQLTLEGVLRTGRRFLLVDYPTTGGIASVADMRSGGIRATIVSYPASAVINWRTEKFGGEHRLSLVVISECAQEVTADGFGLVEVPQYRVLRLIDGRYVVEIYRKDEKDQWVIVNALAPLTSSGRPWKIIPGTFVGAKNNDANIDDAPLYDLAEINVAHYRNSAEYEDTTFMCGQVQPVVTGIDESWVKLLKEEGVKIGSRTILPLPRDSTFAYVQAEANTLPIEAMKHKEEQMIALGAQLIIHGGQSRTATEADSNTSSNTSVLALCVSNVSEAYTMCLGWLLEFMGGSGDATYAINQDFIAIRLDPQLLSALVALWQSGKWPEKDLFEMLRRLGLIDAAKTDEAIKEELDAQEPALNLDAGIGGGIGGGGSGRGAAA